MLPILLGYSEYWRSSPVVRGSLTLLVALTIACSADKSSNFPGDRLWESQHFRYHTREYDRGACAGVLEQLERHFQLMHGYLGFPWQPDQKVDYYKFIDEADYKANSECPSNSGSCTRETSIRSWRTLEKHELIHAYLASLGRPPEFFVEGVATALACPEPEVPLVEPKPWQELVTLAPSDPSIREYVYGGWFVGYLLHRYSPDQFLTFYTALNDIGASAAEIATTFEASFGETIDSVWSASLASSYNTRCVNLWKCSGPTLALDSSTQTLAEACDGSDNNRVFQLSEPTDAVVTIGGPFMHAPTSCDVEIPHAVSGDELGGIYDSTVVPLNSGKYFIQAFGKQAATFSIRALQTKAYSQDCTKVAPVDLSTDEYPRGTFELTVPNDGNAWYVKLNRPIVRPGNVDMLVEECNTCDANPQCVPLGSRGDTHPNADGIVTLRLTGASPDLAYVTSRFLF